jgi:hypothetical protein
MFDVQTHLALTIEQSRTKIPAAAYTLLTGIAKDLSKILAHTNSVRLTAEYEYMLESMAQKDIPDSISFYLNFPKNHDISTKEMEDLFIEQLEVIAESVQSVQKEIRDLMTSSMKTHSRFIKEKFSVLSFEETDEEEPALFQTAATRQPVTIENKVVTEKLVEARQIYTQKPLPKKTSMFRKLFLGGSN